MSRIIVKNLPDNVDPNQIRQKFGEFGNVTDVQLKYTKQGKFRKFGFIGFENEENAQAAINHFNKSFFGTSQIQVENCAGLGDATKPRAWSKYSTESTAFQKQSDGKTSKEEKSNSTKQEKEKKKKKVKGSIQDEELLEQIKKHKDDQEFLDFMELHGKSDKLTGIADDDEEADDSGVGEEKEEEDENKKIATDNSISDLEYLKKKMKGGKVENEKNEGKPLKEKPKFFTVKLKNLPYKTTRKDIEQLFQPLVIDSLRLPKQKGIAFLGFKTEAKMKQALIRNKTFLSGHRILVCEYKNQQEENSSEVNKKWQKQEDEVKNTECIAESGRIFVRNLAYTVDEEELQGLFSKYGSISDFVYPVDKLSRMHKGFAIVTYLFPENAATAYTELDGTVFHGRMLHLIPAKTKESVEEDDEENTNYKKKKLKSLKDKAGSAHNWNTLFLDMNAVAETIADKFNATKEEVLTGKNAAVRMALAETQLVAETKQFLMDNGVKLDMFNQEAKSRSKTVILVKNLPAKTTVAEIRELFIKYGELGRVILPPSGITGIVEFFEPSEARTAFRRLAYSKFKHLPLYLEWAPEDSLLTVKEAEDNKIEKQKEQEETEIREKEEEANEMAPEEGATLFVKNLSFETTEEELKKHFEECGKISTATIAKKKDPKKPGSLLSMGYGFVHFYLKSSLEESLKRLQGSTLKGHQLELKRSNRTLPETEVVQRKSTNMANQTGTKILVRNIPFQATATEIRDLFKTFGELKFVRLPKKLVGTGSHRGFAFVEFTTKQDAKRAMAALGQSTHLLGRRLVLEWAEKEENVSQLREKTAKHYHENVKRFKKSGDIMENVKEGGGLVDEEDESMDF